MQKVHRKRHVSAGLSITVVVVVVVVVVITVVLIVVARSTPAVRIATTVDHSSVFTVSSITYRFDVNGAGESAAVATVTVKAKRLLAKNALSEKSLLRIM